MITDGSLFFVTLMVKIVSIKCTYLKSYNIMNFKKTKSEIIEYIYNSIINNESLFEIFYFPLYNRYHL